MMNNFYCSNLVLSWHQLFAVLSYTDVKPEIPADFPSIQSITQTLRLLFQMGPTNVHSMPSTTIYSELVFLATHTLEKGFP